MVTTTTRTYRYAFKAARTVRSVARSTKGMARLVYGPVLSAPKSLARGAKAGWSEASKS